MKTAKKFAILILMLLLAAAFFPPAYFAEVSANGGITEVYTDIVAPSTYLEYFRLNSPVDVAVRDDDFMIAEKNRLVRYSDGAFTTFDMSGYSISKIALYGNYCLFLSTTIFFPSFLLIFLIALINICKVHREGFNEAF